jgi:hypothetical protein
VDEGGLYLGGTRIGPDSAAGGGTGGRTAFVGGCKVAGGALVGASDGAVLTLTSPPGWTRGGGATSNCEGGGTGNSSGDSADDGLLFVPAGEDGAVETGIGRALPGSEAGCVVVGTLPGVEDAW